MKVFFRGLLLIVLCASFFSCDRSKEVAVITPHIIPKPQQMIVKEGHFIFDKNTKLSANPDFHLAADFLRDYMEQGAGLSFLITSSEKADVIFTKDPSQPSEGYSLDISEEKISIKAADASGAFYAVQTLRQLLPIALEQQNGTETGSFGVRNVSITDAPKFKYRGMHLDVARHFFDKEFVKEYISYISMLKMNYFHWHLTEDQGWRIEIKEYPRLTTHAAYRNETLIGHYNTTPHQFDGKRYGGFYRQEEIKEIVAFAASQNVTIIPEIEMPGHAQAAISAYPELGCTGEAVEVATKWGVFENIYCPNQKTFAFLKNVLTEVCDLFPGEYIHIGGDEAPKKQWKECNHCQKLIKDLNLKDEHELQSYFIKEMEAFVNSKGKKIIGWDEILEGGLAPNATVMSWRGTEGAVEAAKEGHDVILTPGSHAYFDHYQAENDDEPLAIGGFLPLKKVYGFDPVPEELTQEESKFVLGAQGNVWTEYMHTTDHVEYMVFPRILAMSEVVWNGPTTDLETEYSDFLTRVEPFMERMDALDISYANHLYEIEGEVIKESGAAFMTFKTATSGKEIYYRIDEGEVLRYDDPIPITKDMTFVSEVSLDGHPLGKARFDTIIYHHGIAGTITLNVDPHSAYGAGGKNALINGVSGSDIRYGDKEWLGFWGDDLEIMIDFPEPVNLSKVSTRFYSANGQWIYAPKRASIIMTLPDGAKVMTSTKTTQSENKNERIVEFIIPDRPPVITKRLLLVVPNYGMIPEGKQGAGNKAWTFIDEIVVE